MDENYDALDRATLATWRLSNMAGWSVAALAAAILLHQFVDEILRKFRFSSLTAGSLNVRPGADAFGSTFWYWLPKYLIWGALAILVGVVIGVVIGRKVLRRPATVAAITALVYAVIATLVLEYSIVVRYRSQGNPGFGVGVPQHGLPSDTLGWGYALLALAAVIAAPLVARLVAGRRAS